MGQRRQDLHTSHTHSLAQCVMCGHSLLTARSPFPCCATHGRGERLTALARIPRPTQERATVSCQASSCLVRASFPLQAVFLQMQCPHGRHSEGQGWNKHRALGWLRAQRRRDAWHETCLTFGRTAVCSKTAMYGHGVTTGDERLRSECR